MAERPIRRRIALAALGLGIASMLGIVLTGPWYPRSAAMFAQATSAHLDKSDRTLSLFDDQGHVLRVRVTLGNGDPGPKEREGDRRTPEGHYTLSPARPSTEGFNLFMPIDYPNDDDRKRGRTGSDIGIHGLDVWGWLNHALGRDWTAGCVAVSNEDLGIIAASVVVDIPLAIDP